MRYDYSLDVGQSMKSEEEQEKKPTGEELSAKRIEEEIKQEAGKEAQEPAEAPEEEAEAFSEEKLEENSEEISEENLEEFSEEAGENNSSDSEAEKEDDLTVKEISFEKAQLIEEHQRAQKTIDDYERNEGIEAQLSEDEEAGKQRDELEEDVNEIIEDSFKETQSYIKNNNNTAQEYVPEPRRYAVPIALALILLGAIIFGFVYFMHPGETAPAAVADVPGDEIALEPAPEEKIEKVELVKEAVPEKLVIAKNITAPSKSLPPVNKSTNASKITKADAVPKKESIPKSGEQMLNDVLLEGLKD